MKRYLKYFRGNEKYAILAPILMMIDAFCGIFVPLVISKIIDTGIANQDIGYVVKMGLVIAFLAIGVLLGGIGCMYYSAKASFGFGANLREKLMSAIQKFSFNNINKFTTSSIITRLTNDVEVLANLVQMCLRMLVRAPFMFVGGIIMAVIMNKKLSLIVVVLIPLLAIVIVFAIVKAFPLFIKVQSKLDKVNSIIRENLVGSRMVKAFVRQKYEQKRFKKANKEFRDLSIKSMNVMILIMPGVILIMNLGIWLVLWFGTKLALAHEIEVGQISAYITYITMILFSLVMLTMTLMNLSRAKASYDRINEILDEVPDIQEDDSENDKEHNIIAKGKVEYNIKSFEFKDAEGISILENIKFTINPKETVAIIGSTGTGKSTLVNLMPRFYDVTDGYVKIDDVDVKDYNIKTLRSGIGMVLQENRLFSGTIKSNLLWGNENASEEDLIEACKTAQIYDHIFKMKDRLNTVVEQRGTNFSGGQKQRLCIARALVKKPKILILDDSTSALDGETENNLRSSLKESMQDITTFIITQRISSCKLADKVIVIDNGTLVGLDSHEKLLKSNKVYKEIYNSQQGVMANG